VGHPDNGADLEEFVRTRYSDLLRTAYLLTGGSTAAEDLTQQALLVAMRRWDRIDDPMAYLRTTMVHLRISLWRRVLSREVPVGSRPDPGRASSDRTEQHAQRDALLRALARLPVRMRAVLVLRYWEDLSEEATAQILGCGTGSVKSQASRGLARLRRLLDDADSRAPESRITSIARRSA
jgi:RNA polymerase sigma-70 factor (sigma-E family)